MGCVLTEDAVSPMKRTVDKLIKSETFYLLCALPLIFDPTVLNSLVKIL